MLVEAMNWIKQHAAPNIREIDSATWADKEMHIVRNTLSMDKVNFFTLTSLVDYLKSNVDVPNEFVQHIFINVVSPDHVAVYSEANKDNHFTRTPIADVSAMLPVVKIGEWVDQTEFCIMLRANFIDSVYTDGEDIILPDTDKEALIRVASNIVSGTIAEYEDTGISQKATLKTGIQEAEDKLLPEKVVLCPYRTFLEVKQPKSEFIFRAQDSKFGGVQLSLREADGGRWKLDAMAAVKEYLTDQLAGMDYITITA